MAAGVSTDSRTGGARLVALVLMLWVVALAALMFGPSWAVAATYATSCPVTDESCAALAERLELLVAETETLVAVEQGSADQLSLILAVLDDQMALWDGARSGLEPLHVLTGDSGGGAGSEVSLSAEDRELLNLGWYGDAALVGLVLVLAIAGRWFVSWRFLQ